MNTFETVLRLLKNFFSVFKITGGIFLAILTSASVCIFTSLLDIPFLSLGIDASVFTSGHAHKLLSYPFIHCDVMHLLASAAVLVVFSSAVEKGVGTVRFLFVFLFLSTATGLLFALLAALASSENVALGLVPVALSLLGMVTISSRLKKAFFFGVSFPTAALPWIILLAVTLVIPGTVLLCNAIAIIVGIIYGKGWLSVLELSESRAALLEKKMPFRLLKRIMGVRFILASAEERREILHAQCKPPPGSYPVQAYAPTSAAPSTNQMHSIYEGWSHSTYTQLSAAPSLAHMCHRMATAVDMGTAVKEMRTGTVIMGMATAMMDTVIAMKDRNMSRHNMVTMQDNLHITNLDMVWKQLYIVSMCLGPANCMLEVVHTQL